MWCVRRLSCTGLALVTLAAGCKQLGIGDGASGADGEASAGRGDGEPSIEEMLDSMRGVEMPPPLHALEWGMPRQTVAAKLPGSDGTTYAARGFRDLTFYFDYAEATDGLRRASIYIDEDRASALVAEAFGPPERDDDETLEFWFADEAHLRAVLSLAENNADDKMLSFEPLLPFGEIIGPGPQLAILDGRPLLGLTRDEVKSTYADVGRVVSLEAFVSASLQNSFPAGWGDPPPKSQRGSVVLEFPPSRWGQAHTVVFPLFGPDETVTDYILRIDFTHKRTQKTQLMTSLEDKWGTPQIDERSGKFIYGKDPLIFAHERFEGFLDVEVELVHPRQ